MIRRRAIKAPRVPEKQVQRQIVAALRSIGAAVFVIGHPSPNDGRTHRGTGQTAGLPDLLAFIPVYRELPDVTTNIVPMFIEVKAVGGKLRPAQEHFLELCQRSGVHHVVGDLNAVYAWLLRLGVIKDSQIAHYRVSQRKAAG